MTRGHVIQEVATVDEAQVTHICLEVVMGHVVMIVMIAGQKEGDLVILTRMICILKILVLSKLGGVHVLIWVWHHNNVLIFNVDSCIMVQ